MTFDRLSVTVPSDLGAALRTLAVARGETVSTLVTEAIALQVRLAALDLALAEADRKFGAVPQALVATAERELAGRTRDGARSRRKRRPSRPDA